MNVLICIPCLMEGGTEIQTLNLVRALVEAHHQVTTACYFEHSPQMVARYEAAGSRVALLSPQGTRPDGIRQQTVFLYKGLKQLVAQLHPDVAHVQYMAPGALPIVIMRLLGVKKVIATAHTAADIYPSLKLLHLVTKHCLTAFTCITQRAEESFFGTSRLFGSDTVMKAKGNHFTIYNCLPHHIGIRCGQKQYSDTLTLGVVSRLEPIKGMDMVVEAFAKVHKMHPDTRLLVVGDGSLRESMQQQASDLAVSDAVQFVGKQSQDTLQGYYDQIDILLMPSRSEGFGLTAIEGMARGCVVVAADTGGLPEVVTPAVGLLHQPESALDLARKANILVEERQLLAQLSEKAVLRAEHFTFSEYQRIIAELYNRLK